MAGFSIDELMTPLTEDEVFESFLSIAETLGLPARSWRKGAPLRVILRVVARVYSGFTAVMALFIKSGFLETATGEWLTRLALYVYGVTRREATFAREDIVLTNTGGGLYEKDPYTVTVINPTTKKAYRNVAAIVLNPLSSQTVEFEAVEIGSASSSAPNTITELETTLDGVTVTNPRSFIAIDAETDEELRQACRDKLGALSVRGPRSAYRYAIRIAERTDGNPVNINRHSVSSSSSTGKVFVYLAAPDGAPVAEDLEAVEESIERNARPDGVEVTVAAATEIAVNRTLTVWAKRTEGVDAAAIKALVESAFVVEGAVYPIGGIPKPPSTQGKLYADWIIGVAKSAHVSIYEVDGEGADVNLSAGQVPVLSVVANVRIVDVSGGAL